jgi:hypothetical protein
MPKPVEVYQIKVTLRDSQPPIWRRFQVRSDTTLAKFHKILQCVMGWDDTHLHQFIIRGQYYGILAQDEGRRRKVKDEREYELSDVVPTEGSHFAYTYDFGDNWEHDLVVEKKLPTEERIHYPVCLAGARSCPPEDVGGIPRYEDFLWALNNPNHPEHEEFLEWVGGPFDPDAFDVDEINHLLRATR